LTLSESDGAEKCFEGKYGRTPLKGYQFMRHHTYTVKYSVVSINASVLTTTLYFSHITTLPYNYTKYSVSFMAL